MASIPLILRFWLALVYLDAITKGGGGTVWGLEFLTEPSDVVVNKGDSFTWECRAAETDSGPPPNITWRLNGEPIRPDSRRSVLSNGSLHFKRVRKTGVDEGVYECVLQDDKGKIISKPATLSVAGKVEDPEEEAVIIPVNRGLSRSSGADEVVEITEGDVLWLRCPITSTPPHAEPTYTWERGNTILPPNNRYTELPSGVLEIRGVQVVDRGHYRCRALLASMDKYSRPLQLTTSSGSGKNSQVEFLNKQEQILTVKVGENVVLPCGASGLPQPTITWFREQGERLVLNERFIVHGQGSLEIKNITLDQEMIYYCSASNGLSSARRATFRVRVIVPPRIKEEDKRSSHPVARYVTLQCNAQAVPEPVYTWFHNGEKLTTGGRYIVSGNKLNLHNSRAEDSGYYQCRAQNEAGVDQVTTFLQFTASNEAPDIPHNLRVSDVTSNSLVLSWDGSAAVYTVHYQKTNGGIETTEVADSKQEYIDGLDPHENYTFYVTAYSSQGASNPSQPLYQFTKDDVPTTAPQVQVTPLGGSSLKVEWKPLTEEQARGTVIEYEVIYRKANSPSLNVEKVPGDTLEYVITDLEPLMRYEVRVDAKTQAGFADLDDKDRTWVSASTGAVTDITSPEDVRVQSVNSSALLVTWTYDDSDTSFILQWNKLVDSTTHSSTPAESRIDLPSNSRSYVLSHLEANVWYKISLMAVLKGKGDSEPVVREVSTGGGETVSGPDVELPPQPHNVEAKPQNSTAIRITWKMPSMDAYLIHYSSQDGKQGKIVRVTGRQEVLIDNLEPYTYYQFQVQGESGNHRGPLSNEARCRTWEGFPSAPRNLQLHLIDHTTVGLNWDPPVKTNGVITSYIILYKQADSTETPSDTSDMDNNLWSKRNVNGTMTNATIKGLQKITDYLFKVLAVTGAGDGPFSAVETIQTKDVPDVKQPDPITGDRNDKQMGIIVGVSIGGACIILSIIIILLRNRLVASRNPPAEPVTRRVNGTSYIPNVNGNGYGPHGGNARLSSESHELDMLYPMLPPQTRVPENPNTDTRGYGGEVMMNGIHPLNGVRVALQPNGHVRTVPILRNEDADKPQVPERSSSLLASQEESERLMRNYSLDSIDHEEEGTETQSPHHVSVDSGSASLSSTHNSAVHTRHLDSERPGEACPTGSYNRQVPRAPHSEQQQYQHSTQQQPALSATSSHQQQQPQHPGGVGGRSSPATVSSSSGNYSSSSSSSSGQQQQPAASSRDESADTSSTQLLPASRHPPLPRV